MKDLPPGRELDALVAEKLMGWVGIPHPEPESLFRGVEPGISWFPPNNDYAYYRHKFGPGYANGVSFPEYSTDIAAAWEVIEKLPVTEITSCKGNSLLFDAVANIEDRWVVSVRVSVDKDYSNPKFVYGAASTAPHAICLAALKAVTDNE